jgi:hypothetical protein
MRVGIASAALLVAVSGCIINAPDLDELLDTGTSDLPIPTTITGTASMSSTTFATTSTTSTDSTESTGGSSSETGEPASVCDPQPEEVESGVVVDGKPGWDHEHTELTVLCAVTWVGSPGVALHLGLACEDGPHTIDVTDVGPLEVYEGDTVELSLWIDVPWWANVYVALRKDGELVLAAMQADGLPGVDDGAHPPADFWGPLQVALLDDVCEPEADPQDEPCNFICPGTCTHDRRMALAFLDGTEAEVVYDAGSGELGDLVIVVGEAREHVEVFCTDTPGARIGFVALR